MVGPFLPLPDGIDYERMRDEVALMFLAVREPHEFGDMRVPDFKDFGPEFLEGWKEFAKNPCRETATRWVESSALAFRQAGLSFTMIGESPPLTSLEALGFARARRAIEGWSSALPLVLLPEEAEYEAIRDDCARILQLESSYAKAIHVPLDYPPEFVSGWQAFAANPCRSTAIEWIEGSPGFLGLFRQFFESDEHPSIKAAMRFDELELKRQNKKV